MTRRTQDSNLQWLSPSPVFRTGSLPIRIIRHLKGGQKELPIPASAHINNKRGLQLIRICLLPPTPQSIGGHLTGSVARRSTFFIFRIPLVVRVAGLEPARAYAQQILSLWCLPIPPQRHIKNEVAVRSALFNPRIEHLIDSPVCSYLLIITGVAGDTRLELIP